ncbi:MAG: tetratricopeptide repeat protein, partial [Thermoanaerobaculales bacterium]
EQLRYQLREDPSSRLFFQLGDLLRKEGQLEEAVEILRVGLEKHPRYISAWVSLGRGLYSLGDHSGAGAAFERALELDPENAVAARLVGEAAIARQDWLRAVKALKLARGLTAGDTSLDERILFVEARLDARGELQAPAAEVVASGPEREVVSLSTEDPFTVRSAGDTGAWTNVEDVFEAGRVDEVEPEPVPSEETVDSAPEAEAPVAENTEAGIETEEAPPAIDEIPLPTMTLARLAIEQGDLDLAERTLRSLLAREPAHEGAAKLLESLLTDTAEAFVPNPTDTDRGGAVVRALRAWVDGVKLASERLAP